MNRSSVYNETSINTASPTKLVVLLYQGALRFLREAMDDIRRQDYVHKRRSIDRAEAIIQYLQVTLDTERGGAIARELNRLYTYMKLRIYDGSARLDCKPIEEVIQLLETLMSGWEQIEQSDQKPSRPTDLWTQQESGERFDIQA
jgi:flagellar protein FliS